MYLMGPLLLSPLIEGDGNRIPPGLRLTGPGCMLVRANDRWTWMDGSIPVGTVVAVSTLLERDISQVPAGLCLFELSERGCMVAHALMMDGPVPVGTVVAVSNAVGRQQPGLSRSAHFLVIMLNCCTDMLRSSLLSHIHAWRLSGTFVLFCFVCCLQLTLLSFPQTVYCSCAVMLRFPSSFHRIWSEGRTHTHVPAHITNRFTGCCYCRCTCPPF